MFGKAVDPRAGLPKLMLPRYASGLVDLTSIPRDPSADLKDWLT